MEIVARETQLPSRVRLTGLGLEINGEIPFEEWEEAGQSLQIVDRAWRWWVGDWLRYGESRYGEKYVQAVGVGEWLGYDVSSIRNAQWVAERIPPERRRAELPWSYHQAVAKLEAPEQDELLDKAVENGWNRDDLRKAVATFKNELKNGSEPKVDRELSARGQSDAVGTSAQDDEPEEGVETVDWTAELEEANAEVERLLGQIDRLVTDDKDEEIRRLAQENDQLHGRIQEQVRHIMKLEDYEAYAKGEFAKIRELLEVEKTSEIRPAIEVLKERAIELPF